MDLSTYVQELKDNPNVPEVHPGDTVKVTAQVKEESRVRSQVFQGVVIKQGGFGPSASFTVRRISYGVGVERTFLVHSPLLESVEVLRRGSVRRAKLFYLRGRSAKESRIKEKGRLEKGRPTRAQILEPAAPENAAPAQPEAAVSAETAPPAEPKA